LLCERIGLSNKCIDCFSMVSVFSFLHLIWKLTQLAIRLELGFVPADRLYEILYICQSWLRHLVGGLHVEALIHASNDLECARAIFASEKNRRPRGCYTLRQGIRVLERWPPHARRPDRQ